jgi:hypothetical protein
MNRNDLEKLHIAVESLLQQESFSSTVERLNAELSGSPAAFVWATVALDTIGVELPAAIKSCWIVLLKRDVPSGCHYHPNSIQHLIAINGRGHANVGSVSRMMIPFASDRHSLEEQWYVIGQNVPHEFFPEQEDMAVVSFHTCEVTERQEVACGTGENRLYELSKAQPV